jgi:hypothetical protein
MYGNLRHYLMVGAWNQCNQKADDWQFPVLARSCSETFKSSEAQSHNRGNWSQQEALKQTQVRTLLYFNPI